MFGLDTPLKLNQLQTFQDKFESMNRLGVFQEKESMMAFLTAIIKCCDILIDCKANDEPAPFLKITKKEFRYNRFKRKQEEKVEMMKKQLESEKRILDKMITKHEDLQKEEKQYMDLQPNLINEVLNLRLRTESEQKNIDDEKKIIVDQQNKLRFEQLRIENERKRLLEEKDELGKIREHLTVVFKSGNELQIKSLEIEEKIKSFNDYVTTESRKIEIYKAMMEAADLDFEMIPPEHRNITKYDLFAFINDRQLWSEFSIFKTHRLKQKYSKNIVPEKKVIKPLDVETKVNIELRVETKMVVDQVVLDDLKHKFKIVREKLYHMRRVFGSRESQMIDYIENEAEKFFQKELLSDLDLCAQRLEIASDFSKMISMFSRL